jgi:hypothetical protein
MKKSTKTVAGILIGLAATSVIGVGFSTWIINNTTTDLAAGNVTVEVADTEDKSLLISAATVNDGNVRFDAIDDEKEHVITASEDAQCDLVFSFNVTLKVANEATGALKAKITTEDETLKSAISNNWIVSPITSDYMPIGTVTGAAMADKVLALTDGVQHVEFGSVTKTDSTDGSGYCTLATTITCSFTWGSRFGDKNPVIYADSPTAGDTLDKIIADLRTLKAADKATFAVTLETVVD